MLGTVFGLFPQISHINTGYGAEHGHACNGFGDDHFELECLFGRRMLHYPYKSPLLCNNTLYHQRSGLTALSSEEYRHTLLHLKRLIHINTKEKKSCLPLDLTDNLISHHLNTAKRHTHRTMKFNTVIVLAVAVIFSVSVTPSSSEASEHPLT